MSLPIFNRPSRISGKRNWIDSFWLPENKKGDAINASYDQGVLKIKLPKISTLPNSISKVIQIV